MPGYGVCQHSCKIPKFARGMLSTFQGKVVLIPLCDAARCSRPCRDKFQYQAFANENKRLCAMAGKKTREG